MKELALITGASRGIGEEFARLCAADGHDVILVARSKDDLQEVKKELEEKHKVSVTIIEKDLSKIGSGEEVFDEVAKKGLTVTILINNAGFGLFGPFLKTDMERERQMVMVNIVTLMELTKKFLPGMVERKHGRILNVASTAAYEPGPLMSVYYASKAFVLSFSHAIANELRHTGVTVTTLSPGPTRTNFVHESNLERSRLSRMPMMTPEKVARIGYKAMMRGDTEVVAGFYNKIMAFATRLVPRTVTAAIARRVQEKTNN